MSSFHCLLGLPWWRKPSTLPSKSVSAKFPALPLVTCPKYCNFIQANFPINYNIDILVRCSFQEIPSIFFQHHISKDSILFLSDFFNVHNSTPYRNTAQTIDFITLIFNADVTFVSFQFQMVVSSTAFLRAIAIRLLISLVLSPSAVPVPKTWNKQDCNNYRHTSLICHASRFLLIIILNRLRRYSERELPEEQTGFRAGKGTRDALFVLHLVIHRVPKKDATKLCQ